MEHLIFAIYILLFATGFMGIAALAFLRIRSGWRRLDVFLLVQALYVTGLMLVGVYFYLNNITEAGRDTADGLAPSLTLGFGIASTLVNGSIYLAAALAIGKFDCGARKGIVPTVRALALLVVVQTLTELGLAVAGARGASVADTLIRSDEWQFGGYVLTGLTIGAFGFALLVAARTEERPSMRLLLRGYGLSALGFAPFGFVEWALNRSSGVPWRPLSLDYLFYLAWNLVAIAAFARSLVRGEAAGPVLSAVPEETADALGLTARERDMALMIARGLANKEIAAELGISPATVRTHIYNLYRKVGARSRVELINKLRT